MQRPSEDARLVAQLATTLMAGSPFPLDPHVTGGSEETRGRRAVKAAVYLLEQAENAVKPGSIRCENGEAPAPAEVVYFGDPAWQPAVPER